MSLTLRAEQRLNAVGLVAYFEEDPKAWLALAKETHSFVKSQFPKGATVRPDDVAQTMVPLLAVKVALTNTLREKKCKELYWIEYFADLILDRTWEKIA